MGKARRTGRKIGRLFWLLVLSLCISSAAAQPLTAVTVSAASAKKSGLVKSGGKYYYYSNGKKVKNTWKTIRVNGKKRLYYFGKTGAAYTGGFKTIDGERYYFRKNGAAYCGKKQYGVECAVIKKIGKYKYAFDSKGRMLTGVQVINDQFYVFNKNGRYNSTKTKALKKLYSGNTGEEAALEPLQAQLEKYGAVFKSTEWDSAACYGDGVTGCMYFEDFQMTLFRYNEDGRVVVLAIAAS